MNNTTPFVGHDAHTHSKKTYAFASATGEVERKSLGYEPGELASWIKPCPSPQDAFTSQLAASTYTASCPTGFRWKQIGSRAKSTDLDPSASIDNVRLVKKNGRLNHTSILARRSINAHSVNRQNQFNYTVSSKKPFCLLYSFGGVHSPSSVLGAVAAPPPLPPGAGAGLTAPPDDGASEPALPPPEDDPPP